MNAPGTDDGDGPAGRTPAAPRASVGRRLERSIGPLAAGLILDGLDLATFGPMGVVVGPFVGGVAGWYLGRALGFPARWRPPAAILAAIYCMLPFTEFIPAATVLGAVSRFFEPPRPQDGEAS